nr:PrsW family intramembrane metalloprotease [Clostridiales bacterium]
MTILLLAALLPPIILMIWVYKLDKIESEPPRLILKLLLFGALSCIPAALIEGFAGGLLSNVVPPYSNGTLYQFLYYFLVVAWTEEGVKHFALKHGSWKNPAFNYRFDAIVYAT